MTANVEPTRLIEILVAARALLLKGWCREVCARDAYGKAVQSGSAVACKWCLSGAIRKAAGVGELIDAVAVVLLTHLGEDMTLPQFNDRQESVEPVIDLIDKAIKHLKQGELA